MRVIPSKPPVTFAPIPVLRDVRAFCLAHSETRCPIWRFKITKNLVLSIQPRPAHLPTEAEAAFGVRAQVVRFECIAVTVETGEATAAMLTAKLYEFEPKILWRRREFEIIEYAGDSERWYLSLRGASHARRTAIDGVFKLDKRIAGIFAGRFFKNLSPGDMLGCQCWICGHPLTDPVSMARGIGPECAGSSSIVTPFTIAMKGWRWP
jgi:hypothetical protein